MTNNMDFVYGNTKHCLLAMALPMLAAMFLNMMYNLVDSLWIGNLLGETAYAALTKFDSHYSHSHFYRHGSYKRYLHTAFTGDWREK